MPRLRVPVTPAVMKWCRIKSGYSIETAAQKIGRPPEEIRGWEDGSLQPTLSQARKASEKYKRPLAVFFLPEPPQDFSTLRDFRTLPRDYPREYSSELVFLIREAHMRQEWAREFLRDEGAEELSFVGSANLQSNPNDVARNIREVLSISIREQQACRTREEALLLWIRKAEDAGIFVFQQSKIEPVEARGFVLCDKYAPFIFLNANDAKAGRLFTLVHELAHLWINKPGVSNLEDIWREGRSAENKIEIFCNRVAAEALVDSLSFETLWRRIPKEFELERKIENISQKFKVSEEVIARKLLQQQRITETQYTNLRTMYQARWREIENKDKKSHKEREKGPSYYRIKAFNVGYAFTRTVLSAYWNGLILGKEASSLLGVKLNHMEKLAKCAAIPFRRS